MLKQTWSSWEKSSSWRQHISLQNSNMSLCMNGTLTYMQITHSVGTDAPPYHQRLVFALFNGNRIVFHLWHVVPDVRFSPKQAEMWTRLTREHVSTVFRSISDDFAPRELGGVSAQNYIITLHNTISSCISWCCGRLCDNGFPKYSRAHMAMSIMTVSQTIPPEGSARWSRAFSSSFCPWSLRTKIFPDSLNLSTILWTGDGKRPKFFAILHSETLSLNWLTILTGSLV